MRTIKRIRERRRQKLLRFLAYPQRNTLGADSVIRDNTLISSGVWALPDRREQEPPGPDITEWTLRHRFPHGLGGL